MYLLYNDRIISCAIVVIIQAILLLVVRKVISKKVQKRWYGKSQIIIGVLVVILVCTGYFGKRVSIEKADTTVYTVKELKEDMEQLEHIIFTKAPLYYADKEKLRQDFDRVKASIQDGMTEEEFYRLINPLVVQTLCGHTNLSISRALQENRKGRAIFFPIVVRVHDNQLVVANNQKEYGVEEGDVIESINGRDAADIISTLLRNISHDGDNDAIGYYTLNQYFAVKYYDFIDQSQSYEVEYHDANGELKNITVEAISKEEWNVNAWDLKMKSYEDGNYYDYTMEEDRATLRIHVFMEEKKSFSKFLKEFFTAVKEKGIHHITIDVQGNYGGDAKMAKELLSYLITEDMEYFKGKLPFIMKVLGYDRTVKAKNSLIDFETELLVDGGDFSTCAHFVSIYKSLGLGQVIGKNTGGGSICTDGSKNTVLRNTGIRLHYSTTVFQVNSSLDRTNVVEPDRYVE